MNDSRSLSVGDLIIVAFPLTSGVDAKPRPAVALASENWSSPDAILLVASVSSSDARFEDAGSVVLIEWDRLGLERASVVQTHRLFSTQQRYVYKTLGRLDKRTREAVLANATGFLTGNEPSHLRKMPGDSAGHLQQTGVDSPGNKPGMPPDD
ncbi:type II toxin-antitoxin system PemK/MazF family toxin [Homoserinibacter sp. GY 40078]|uniref:type II toxin-antitoxin system PemK/MazF family toxin n=1 Tax=Homoserinibacter sp. GY 40078 TaxID=2603275 RepID=UPI0011C8D274|nr:type II toxin-antitoxin system PemK/MazF family toxin [Homoserinibacter sp. GY 40078]TXK18684.1 type II toxin-antitoxin system PemK/MazF family toxin [Homoserinibacter sp. GY 40078]